MKWNFRTKVIESNKKYQEWHEWFAWYPVKVNEEEKVWLETIVRKQVGWKDWSWFERLLCKPKFMYRESIFDLLKEDRYNEKEGLGATEVFAGYSMKASSTMHGSVACSPKTGIGPAPGLTSPK